MLKNLKTYILSLAMLSLIGGSIFPMDKNPFVFFNEKPAHQDAVSAVCFSPDGKLLASGSHDKSVKIWNVSTGKCVKVFIDKSENKNTDAGDVYSVCFSPNGQLLLSGHYDGKIRMWEVKSGKCSIIQGHTYIVSSICFSPNGKYFYSGSYDRTIKKWNTQTGHCMNTFKGHTGLISSICINGTFLASGSHDKTLRIWSTRTGQCFNIIEDKKNEISSLCFSPDLKFIALGCGKIINIWNFEQNRFFTQLLGHTDRISSLCFSPNGDHLISGSFDKTIKVWSMKKYKCIKTSEGHLESILSVDLSRNKVIASGDYLGRIIMQTF